MELTKDQLANIISASIMCVMDNHPTSILGNAKYLSDKIFDITGDIDLANHAEACVIAALTSSDNVLSK